MKITSNTSPEEVKEKTKNTFESMCSIDENYDKSSNGAEIRKLFDKFREKNIQLDKDVLTRLFELQNYISSERNVNISTDKLLDFLKNAMNYGEFQLWLEENRSNGITLSFNDKLKKFLSEKTNEDILQLFDIEQNYNERNIESIQKSLDEALPTPYGMFINESGNGIKPEITEASRKECVKALLK